jgi:predicted LPLAT superfamily acyltransferase
MNKPRRVAPTDLVFCEDALDALEGERESIDVVVVADIDTDVAFDVVDAVDVVVVVVVVADDAETVDGEIDNSVCKFSSAPTIL